jgi:glycosyltransferase involved in cell wall biosynthesis
VLPSSHENFGIAAAEALARGLPVLLTEGVAIARDVAAAGAGLVVPATADRLAEALARLAGDAAWTAAASPAAAALARREYSWPRTAERLGELYAELTAGRPARRAAARTPAPNSR